MLHLAAATVARGVPDAALNVEVRGHHHQSARRPDHTSGSCTPSRAKRLKSLRQCSWNLKGTRSSVLCCAKPHYQAISSILWCATIHCYRTFRPLTVVVVQLRRLDPEFDYDNIVLTRRPWPYCRQPAPEQQHVPI
jgi:hypothetical protein